MWTNKEIINVKYYSNHDYSENILHSLGKNASNDMRTKRVHRSVTMSPNEIYKYVLLVVYVA